MQEEDARTTEGSLGWVLCWLDQSFVFVYTGLIGATLLSVLSPFFRNLSLHGKTRSFVVTHLNQVERSNHTFIVIIGAWIRSFAHEWEVQKSYFVHFYAIGILSLSLCWTCLSHRIHAPTILLLLLLSTHLLRRLYECKLVHQWTTSSKMHIMGYFAGMAHYVWLPYAFMHAPCGDSRTNHHHHHQVEHTDSSWLSFLVFLLGLWAQYQQHRHHVLLAHLRTSNNNNNGNDSPPQVNYRIPKGGWFQWVSCPHYLAEITLYGCFTILIQFDTPNHFPRRTVLVFLFVVLNLSVAATRTHRWYCENSPGYVKLQRYALVPFLV